MEYACYDILTLKNITLSLDLQKRLYQNGAIGVEPINKTSFKVYLNPSSTDQIKSLVPSPVQTQLTQVKIPVEVKPANFDPYAFVGNFEIVPANSSYSFDQHKIAIYHGSGFGTGLHPTTELCAQRLLTLNSNRFNSTLDFGTGNGILSILAHRLGYKNIHATEILEEARILAKKNFEINNCEIQMMSNLSDFENTFDLIIANVLGPTLLAHADVIISALNPGGTLIISGFRENEEGLIEETYKKLKMKKLECLDGWGIGHFSYP